MKYPNALLQLVRSLARLPGVGPKSAQKLALYLAQHAEAAETLEQALRGVRERVRPCVRCGNLAEAELCPVCADPGRDHGVICVVETPGDLLAIEKSGEYNGVYHVLGGALNPLEGIGPEDLRVAELLERLEGVQEVILATSMTVEGEATAGYLAELLKARGLRATRPAYGLPVGGALEYVDEVTLARALAHRRAFSE
ncbi:recombination mediator RecR [Marinithermus hydrothermalis]|uniref:Recombination protein RecR n=1 Tax=Marinithermus hydrothermalis (strain DSM 14884 / JCM 11576 / T1) TaxID=869210 RepID=F2NNZ5_MARHT|nr:recombination mediator RecR [Marinithermus hydrothermalis]AEB11583.1 Recombination protein recR [Marinithermus hydrothermalis DSM 14884]